MAAPTDSFNRSRNVLGITTPVLRHWLAMTWSFIARGGQWPPLLILSIVLGKSGG